MSDTQDQAVEPVEEIEQEDTGLEQPDGHVEDVETDDDQDDDGFDRERTLQKLRKLNSENRNLRKAKKEAEEKASKAGADSERVQALEAVNARYETLAENGLPLQLAKWINATDSEEILEQAEELLSLGSGGNKPPSITPKERVKKNRQQVTNTDEIGDLDDFAAKIYND